MNPVPTSIEDAVIVSVFFICIAAVLIVLIIRNT